MSFFGKKEEESSSNNNKSKILRTNGHIDTLVVSLLNAANDNESTAAGTGGTGSKDKDKDKDSLITVKSSISSSLRDIGIQQPSLVLSTSIDFIQTQGKKIQMVHRILVLNVMVDILDRVRDQVPEDLGKQIVLFAAAEMTANKEVEVSWQDAASRILVSISHVYPNPVFDEMLVRFEPGVVPHYFVIKTIADFAAANPIAFVPRLKEILARVLPILGNVKFDNLRWAISAACSHFAEAVVSYSLNVPSNKAVVLTTDFQSEFYTLFEVLYNQWLQSRELRVRLCTIQAIGNSCALLSPAHFELNFPKIIKAIIEMYKAEKESDRLPITQGLTTVLTTAVASENNIFEPQLSIVVNTIFPIGDPTASKDAAINKNYNEVLRCFEIIGKGYIDQLISTILKRMETPQPPVRVGCLFILKHLVSRLQEKLLEQDRRPLIVAGVVPMVQDPAIPVRRAFSQLIIAMAADGYLKLEGGEKLVEFVVRNSSVSEREIKEHKELVKQGKRDANVPSPAEMRDISCRMLEMMTTTIPAMENVLWPYLLETVAPAQYKDALGMVCRCIAHLAGKKRSEKAVDYLIDFDKLVNLPKPQQIIARLIVVLCNPKAQHSLGERIIESLLNLGETLHPSLPELWDAKLPKILNFLKTKLANAAEWDDQVWNDIVLRLLSESIDIINDDEWNVALGEALSEQMAIYKDDVVLKRQCLRFLGMCLQKSSNKQFIRNKLDFLFNTIDYNQSVERIGCSEAFGLTSAHLLDMVLEKLTKVCKEDVIPKSTGFFGMSSDKSPEQIDRMKATAALCYGRITANADVNILTSRMEMHILTHIIPFFTEAKSAVLRECCIQAAQMMSVALHPSKLTATQQPNYQLKARDQMVTSILSYLTVPKDAKLEKEAVIRLNESRIQGLLAIKDLILLPPTSSEMETLLISKTIDFNDVPDVVEDENSKKCRLALNDMLSAILFMSPNTATLGRLIRAFESQVVSPKANLRERACDSIWYILKKFMEYLGAGRVVLPSENNDAGSKSPVSTTSSTSTASSAPGTDKKSRTTNNASPPTATESIGFADIGLYIAMLLPRCSDPEVSVRDKAMRTLQTMLFVDHKLANPKANDDIPPTIQALTEIKNRLKTVADVQEQYACMGDLSKTVALIVSQVELPVMLLASMLGLSDSQDTSATGTAVVINGLVRARGPELAPNIPSLVAGMLTAMEKIKAEQAMNGILLTFRTFARHHLIAIIEELLSKPIPHSVHVVKAFQIIVKDEKLSQSVTDHVFGIINNQSPYDDKADPKTKGKNIRVACVKPMSALLALGEFFDCPELKDHCSQKNFPSMCMGLLLRFGVTIGLTEPQANKDIVSVFKKFLTLTEEEAALKEFELATNLPKFSTPEFYDAVAALTLVIGKKHKTQIEEMYQFVFPYLNRLNYAGFRIGAASIISEFITLMDGQNPLLGQLINCLLARLADDDETVKLVSFRGLGNVSAVSKTEVDRYSGSLLNALMTGMDDPSESLSMMSMTSLSRIFELVDEQQVAPVIVSLSLRLKPIFEKTTASLRAAAFTLFGTLSRFGGSYGAQTFLEQIHANLTPLICHMNDDDAKVSEACKKSLKQVAPLLKNKEITKFFESNKATTLDYESFLCDFSKLIVVHSPERLNFYFAACANYYKSSWAIIRANAVTYIGYLVRSSCSQLDANTVRNLSLDHVATNIMTALKDPTSNVRMKAAQSIALMYDI